MISYNPCSKVVIPKNNENGKAEVREKRIYTKAQARDFLKILAEAPLKYRVFFTILMFTGFRRGELLGLEWKDFDFEKMTIHINRTSNYTMKKGMYTDTTKTEKSRMRATAYCLSELSAVILGFARFETVLLM
ncbi:MAG: tyrosine-type recombinase/integrase [Ruminococcus sp.]|nr:tyrosine-type recombinase/integrase [Ruminococcus sp.]